MNCSSPTSEWPRGMLTTLKKSRKMTQSAQDVPGVGIAQIVTFCKTDNRLVILYNYVAGKSLDFHLKRLGEADFRSKAHYLRSLKLLEKVCDALAFSHSQGIIHLDVSPCNILIESADEENPIWHEDSTIKLIDFDTARVATGRGGVSYTNVLVAGTARFIDPEFLMHPGRTPVPGNDLYSVAMVAKAMICRRPEASEKPSEVCPAASPVFDEIIATATQLETPGQRGSSKRFRDAGELKRCFAFLRELAAGNVWRGRSRNAQLALAVVFLVYGMAILPGFPTHSWVDGLRVLAPLFGILCLSPYLHTAIVYGLGMVDGILNDQRQRVFTAALFCAWAGLAVASWFHPKLFYVFLAIGLWAEAGRIWLYRRPKIDLGVSRSWEMDRFGVSVHAGAGFACIVGFVLADRAGDAEPVYTMVYNLCTLIFTVLAQPVHEAGLPDPVCMSVQGHRLDQHHRRPGAAVTIGTVCRRNGAAAGTAVGRRSVCPRRGWRRAFRYQPRSGVGSPTMPREKPPPQCGRGVLLP